MESFLSAIASIIERGWRFGLLLVLISLSVEIGIQTSLLILTEPYKTCFRLGIFIGGGMVSARLVTDIVEYTLKCHADYLSRKKALQQDGLTEDLVKTLSSQEIAFLSQYFKSQDEFMDVYIYGSPYKELKGRGFLEVVRGVSDGVYVARVPRKFWPTLVNTYDFSVNMEKEKQLASIRAFPRFRICAGLKK